jgi:hypothetical protein
VKEKLSNHLGKLEILIRDVGQPMLMVCNSAEICLLGGHISQDGEREDPEVQVEGNGDCDGWRGQRTNLSSINSETM